MSASITLTFLRTAPESFDVTGRDFGPDGWIWITVEDLTAHTQVVDGPEAFLPSADGTFRRTSPPAPTAGHVYQARAFVDDVVVARSVPVAAPTAPATADPADPHATAAVRALLDDLRTAPQRADHRLVVGQALRGWDFDRPVDQPITALAQQGLPVPVLVEVDLTSFGVTTAHDDELYELLGRHASRGGLIGVSHHVGNPFNGKDVGNRDDVDLPQLTDPAATPTTETQKRWRAALDTCADVMGRLDDTVVLFRPLHESNGDWFWWGQRDPDDFAAVWRGMFRYLTDVRGLHHLLWVYAANRNFGGDLLDPRRLYPGDDLVDVVGLDIYDDDLADATPGAPGYEALIALGKPFGITEYGALNWPSPHDGAVHLPNDEVMSVIRARYPRTVLATSWYSSVTAGVDDHWQISDRPNAASLLRDPWAITLPVGH